MELREVDINEIKPYENNPRNNDNAVDAVMESIKQCGYIAPIIVDENMVVLAGHTRLKAVKRLGWTSVRIAVAEGLSEVQKKKYRLLDNKTNEMAEWNLEQLEQELQDMDFDGFDFGFDLNIDDDETEKVKEDDFEEKLPDIPTTKLGQVYQLGRHRLMCGDSTILEDVRKLVGG